MNRNARMALMDYLLKQGKKPRVHGNGFIQVDISPADRLHIWGHPDIPRQKVDTGIHNHVFSFDSQIIVGKMVNVTYEVGLIPNGADTGSWKLYHPEIREGEDTILKDSGLRVTARERSHQMIKAGTEKDGYHFEKWVYHRTVTNFGPAATIINKYESTQAQGNDNLPGVLVPFGAEPDNEFSRYGAADYYLWDIVYQVLATKD